MGVCCILCWHPVPAMHTARRCAAAPNDSPPRFSQPLCTTKTTPAMRRECLQCLLSPHACPHTCVRACTLKLMCTVTAPTVLPLFRGSHSLSQQPLHLHSRRLAAEEAAACRLAMRNRTLSILTAGGGSPQLAQVRRHGRPRHRNSIQAQHVASADPCLCASVEHDSGAR